MLLCPVCGVQLQTHAVRDRSLRICDRCGGTWLDNATSGEVVRGTLSAADKEVAAWAERHATGAPHPAPMPVSVQQDAPYRGTVTVTTGSPCPECGAPMRTHTIPSIEVTLDVCATHGTWFDASELRIVARHFERKAASDDAAAAAFGAQLTEQRTMDALTVRPLGGWGLFTLDVLLRLLR